MRSPALLTAVLIAANATLATAQPGGAPSKPAPAIQVPAGAAGTWEGKSMIGPKDSVTATWVVTATATTVGWSLKPPNRDPVPTRIIAAGGDSVVSESGPYDSVLRLGQKVTSRTTAHYKGDTMTGTFTAKYGNGEILNGKITGARKK